MRLFGKHNGFDPNTKLATGFNHKKFIESLPCPSCSAQKLAVTLLEEGTKGWEARVFCGQCHSKGVLTDNGFHLEFVRVEVKE